MKMEKIIRIKNEIEKEFPGDFALQQVHIARKLLSEEARERGISLWEYIKTQAEEAKRSATWRLVDEDTGDTRTESQPVGKA
ncbi:hypothetical protein J7M22_06610 [Candidatus Poribacteria bacterium]|nr:hypothetical protein [Candidatus Poribacteria bacterium]